MVMVSLFAPVVETIKDVDGHSHAPPRQSPKRGRQKSISPQGQWFPKVESANIGAFE
jgi:hypothetical protein